MPGYRHSPHLQSYNIRLLQLLPGKENSKNVQCKLFECALQKSDEVSRPYEALSYVWGSTENPQSIIILEDQKDDQEFTVTQNLHAALLHLQDHDIPRILWVDAICIDQSNNTEKGSQILLMAEIYAKASRVIVWLGEAQEYRDQALETVRVAAENPMDLSKTQPFQQQRISMLLQRPWFRRIWVLQEVAAARQVLIKCGFTEIDGHVFCLGLEYLNRTLQIPMNPVTFLIRQAIFRSRHIPKTQERFSLNICSLGELVDMYHAHEATEPLDKVYALLGMCSDDLTTVGLGPDYTIQWGELSQKLIKFLFGHNITVETSDNIQTAVIKTKGCVLGRVSSARSKNDLGNRQDVEAAFKVRSMQSGTTRDGNAHWTLRITSKSIQDGDLVCFLEGARKPTIIRVIENYSAIIMSTATPPKRIRTGNGHIEWAEFIKTASFTRDFLLIWDWKVSLKNLQHPGKYDVLIQTDNRQSQPTKMEFADSLDDAFRTWNIAQILGDAEVFKEAEEKKQKATEVFQRVVRKEHLHSLECSCSQVPLLWAAENGDDAVVGMLLAKDDVDLKIKDYSGQTPLSWAAENGHEAVVKLLLEAGKVDVDSKDNNDQTPLSLAARNGHEAVVKLLLETGKVDADSKDSKYGQTSLSWAAQKGHEAVVKLL
ncbi:uncharacterized protein K441DRAFT_586923, partial [Cenococcum geophilum 1.58]|uniref:uncharacterized protein n=1 Tax=Cenococcum geophilum 1.58 TaxID=794803 RepID=UPI00358F4732